jgi:TRAP-type C4-dicarboxylate transport system permease small subunit
LKTLRTVADGIGAMMFVVVFLLFCLKIVMRYVWHNEFAWTDEICTILFIWIIFWASSFMLAEKDHIRFDLLVRSLPNRVASFVPVVNALIVGGIFTFALPETLGYVLFLHREKTPVLQLPLSYVYFCFFMYAAVVSLRYAHVLVGTLVKGSSGRNRRAGRVNNE